MIFLPSCSIHVSSDLESAETLGSTVLHVKPEKEITRFVRNSHFLCGIFQSIYAPYYADLHMHI